MSKPTHAHIEKLFTELIIPFYHLKRGTRIPDKGRRWENDAEHSWSLAFLACTLAPEIDPGLDVGKVCQIAVVHDLVEVYAGDTDVFASAEVLATKDEREAAALQKIRQEFKHFPWIATTIDAYERRETNEGKFVYAMDKYIGCMFDYLDKGRLFQKAKVSLDSYNKTLELHRRKAQSHPGVFEYYEKLRALLDAHPEFFHMPKEA